MAVLLVPLLAVPASAHGEHKVANYTFVVGFGTEPAYAGTTNSVQIIISNNGKPVTNAKGLKAGGQHRRRRAEGDGPRAILRRGLGTAGRLPRLLHPDRARRLHLQDHRHPRRQEDRQEPHSGKDGFDEITDPAEVQYPAVEPSVQVTTKLDRETARLNAALAADREAAEDEAADARQLATVGLVVGALGLLAAVGVGVVALRPEVLTAVQHPIEVPGPGGRGGRWLGRVGLATVLARLLLLAPWGRQVRTPCSRSPTRDRVVPRAGAGPGRAHLHRAPRTGPVQHQRARHQRRAGRARPGGPGGRGAPAVRGRPRRLGRRHLHGELAGRLQGRRPRHRRVLRLQDRRPGADGRLKAQAATQGGDPSPSAPATAAWPSMSG